MLAHAILAGADLHGAALTDADLHGADLHDSVLQRADMAGVGEALLPNCLRQASASEVDGNARFVRRGRRATGSAP